MDTEKLKEFQLALVKAPELQPSNGKTFCNIGARRMAQFFGLTIFDDQNLMADDMIKILVTNPNFAFSCGQLATDNALEGGLGFAVMTSARLGEAHGHIASIFPAPMELSPSLDKGVPMAANVGIKNGILKISEIFPVSKGEPIYFILKQNGTA